MQKGLLGPIMDLGYCPEDSGKPWRVGSQVA